MKIIRLLAFAALLPLPAVAAPIVTTEFDAGAVNPSGFFDFDNIMGNVSTDIANGITPSLVGSINPSSSITNLTNGPAQTSITGNIAESTTADNNTIARYIVDLGDSFEIAMVNTFSAHDGARAAQSYNLYAALSPSNTAPSLAIDPTTVGWSFITDVATASNGDGKWGVNITDDSGSLGTYRYWMIEVRQAPGAGMLRTNYGEWDIIQVPEPGTATLLAVASAAMLVLKRRRRR
ncbi:MAG: PEP-CTERM sorting domain-containing protein [Verrucomicrobiota bacterium]